MQNEPRSCYLDERGCKVAIYSQRQAQFIALVDADVFLLYDCPVTVLKPTMLSASDMVDMAYFEPDVYAEVINSYPLFAGIDYHAGRTEYVLRTPKDWTIISYDTINGGSKFAWCKTENATKFNGTRLTVEQLKNMLPMAFVVALLDTVLLSERLDV